jgi:hypothetical protein
MIYGSNFSDKDEHSHKSAYVSREKLTDKGVPIAVNSLEDGNS